VSCQIAHIIIFSIVGILFAFLLSTFDLPLSLQLVHNVFCGAHNFLALLAHLSYRDHSSVFLSAEANNLRDSLAIANWNPIFDLTLCNFF
jgi:hypothetical protein